MDEPEEVDRKPPMGPVVMECPAGTHETVRNLGG
jgi:hypothetical protein